MTHKLLKLTLVAVLIVFLCDDRAASQLATQTQSEKDADGLVDNLIEKIRQGNFQTIESLLATGVDINRKNKNGETALAVAANLHRGAEEIIELLLNRGAKIDERSLGSSAIWVDIRFGFFDRPMPSYSFRCGNSIGPMSEEYSKTDKIGATPLMVAISSGHPKIVEQLIARGAEVDARTFAGVSPLMLATISNDLESMELLLRKGADVNATANKGQTALMLASWSDGRGIGEQRLKAIQLLVESGANVNAQDEEGISALLGAAVADNLAAAQFLISKDAHVNAKSKKGRTALILAADTGNVEMLKLLLKNGADANVQDHNGQTALMEAASLHQKPEAVAVLINGGANVAQKDNKEASTALLVAELTDRVAAAQQLKQAGATLSDNEALVLAANKGDIEKVRNLLANGADVNASGVGGKSALMYAARNPSAAVAVLLIENGANVNARDNIGETPLIAASYYGATEVAKLLVEHGADINTRSNAEMTALINAAWRGRLDIVRLLVGKVQT
jgi:ankyrin repeat protein